MTQVEEFDFNQTFIVDHERIIHNRRLAEKQVENQILKDTIDELLEQIEAIRKHHPCCLNDNQVSHQPTCKYCVCNSCL